MRPHSHPVPVSIGLDIDMEVPIGPCAEVALGADLPYRIEGFTKIHHQASPLIVVQGPVAIGPQRGKISSKSPAPFRNLGYGRSSLNDAIRDQILEDSENWDWPIR